MQGRKWKIAQMVGKIKGRNGQEGKIKIKLKEWNEGKISQTERKYIFYPITLILQGKPLNPTLEPPPRKTNKQTNKQVENKIGKDLV